MATNDNINTENLQRKLIEGEDLDEFIYHNINIFNEDNYHSYLVARQRRSPYSIKDIIDGTYIDPSYCYQIFRGIRTPNRDITVQICIFLQLALLDVNRLIKLSGHRGLYIKDLRDTIIIHAFNKGWSLDELEEVLIEKGCDGLMN